FFGVGRGVLIIGLLFTFIISISGRLFIGKQEYTIFIVLLIFTCLSVLPTVYNGIFDVSVFLMYLKMCIYFILCLGFVRFFRNKNMFISVLKGTVFLQFIVILLCMISPGIRDFIFSVHTVEDRFLTSEQAYRLYFLSSSSFFQLSLFFGFLFHFMVALYREGKVGLTTLILLFICGAFSGRAFFVFSVITVIFYGIKLKYIPIYITITFMLIFIAIKFSENTFVGHALEPLINYINSGELETNSSDKLVEKMLFIPNFASLVIGDGLYYNNDGSYYMHTDSGFVRQLLYGGFIYLTCCFGLTLYLLVKLSKNWFRNYRKFYMSTIIIFLIGNVKADVLMYPGITINLIFILVLMSEARHDKNIHRIPS
ncbi:hypothetical protein ACJET8_000001, partial [Citrobacter farmeri]